jgi:hypothetical protein
MNMNGAIDGWVGWDWGSMDGWDDVDDDNDVGMNCVVGKKIRSIH